MKVAHYRCIGAVSVGCIGGLDAELNPSYNALTVVHSGGRYG